MSPLLIPRERRSRRERESTRRRRRAPFAEPMVRIRFPPARSLVRTVIEAMSVADRPPGQLPGVAATWCGMCDRP